MNETIKYRFQHGRILIKDNSHPNRHPHGWYIAFHWTMILKKIAFYRKHYGPGWVTINFWLLGLEVSHVNTCRSDDDAA